MSSVKIQGDASGTGILTIAAPNTNTDRTLTLPDEAGTLAVTNSQLFEARANADTTTTHNADFKIAFEDEIYDPSGIYDLSLSRFQPTVAGYYRVYGSMIGDPLTTGSTITWRLKLYKNGVQDHIMAWSYAFNTTSTHFLSNSTIVYMNGTSDYVELYAYQNDSNLRYVKGTAATKFSAEFISS